MKLNCLQKWDRPHTASVHVQEMDRGEMDETIFMNPPQGEEESPEDGDIEQEYLLLDEEECPDVNTKDD